MRLSVHLVTWNGKKYIPYIFDSLRQQTFKDFEVLILDNNSTDGTLQEIQKELSHVSFKNTLITSDENVGFAAGHNELYKESCEQKKNAEYIICLNQDIYLEKDCFEKLIAYMDEHVDIASISPRVMKWNFAPLEQNFQYAALGMKGSTDKNNNLEMDFFLSDIVDTLGLKVFRSRRVIDQYAGENWEYLKQKLQLSVLDVFGVSGACPLYRKNAIDAIAFEDKTFFDELYHSYKEDVDLAYRLNRAGYRSCVLLDAVVYHDRSAAGEKKLSDVAASKNKKNQSTWVKYHSYKNHIMTLYKNETVKNLLLDFPFILWYEVKKFGWFFLFDRSVLQGLSEVWKNRNVLMQKRRSVQLKKNSKNTLRKWFKK